MGRMPLQKWIINMRMVEKRLERQRRKMKKDEQKMMKEVKQAIENDDMQSAKLFAKDIARNRKMAHNLQRLRSQVKGIGYKLEQASAVKAIGGDLRGLVMDSVSMTDDEVGVDSEANQIIEEIQTAGAVKSGLPVPADSRDQAIEDRLQKLKEEKK
jgi:uncharacterized protein YigA (DUF484 family)